ncbi:Acts as a sulfur carrier required for molybdopterin biosynthesis [Coemansia sp. Benny D115]|nr:Acts as a sulfur carrier required for molybdopterin biosynthesis [Coemansia sp. Benny D115]
MVSVKVLYFASASDATQGVGEETIEVAADQPQTLGTVVEMVKSKYPGLASVLKTALLSLNQEYCDGESHDTTLLRDGDEVAIIPP